MNYDNRTHRVRFGIEVALQDTPQIMHGAIGLVTNQAGVDSELNHDIDLLTRLPGVKLTALFGPEHGLRGEVQAGAHVESSMDASTGLPIYSLYGQTNTPTEEMLKGIDVLVIDLQDAGARYWTFIYTMARCIKAGAEHHIPVVVLDRPNPVGGSKSEGNIQDDTFLSSIGLYPLPMRHGLTMGEMARYFNKVFQLGADLTVVPCDGWQRNMLLSDTRLPYVPGSPNTPTIESLLLYSGTCLIEGTTLSEGRGTTKPFEMIGAPWVDAVALSSELNHRKLPGVRFRPAYFVPTFSKHQGEPCSGIQIHIYDPHVLEAVSVGVHLITTLRDLHPDHFSWRPPYRPGGRYFIDLLAGTDQFRSIVDGGTAAEDILASWTPTRQVFQSELSEILLY